MEQKPPQPSAATELHEGEAAQAASGEFLPLEEVEKRQILRALERTHGNRTQAAEILGISIRTLRNKLHEYHVEPVA
jgi:DNA-binding NtrC family response regulator